VEKDWVKVFSSNSQNEVMIRKLRLENEAIPTILINKKDSSYPVFGIIELYVHRDKQLKARQLLAHEL
jgi:hypothetical protein